jgi:hypothetical protein
MTTSPQEMNRHNVAIGLQAEIFEAKYQWWKVGRYFTSN